MSDLVRNPEARVSRVEAQTHMILSGVVVDSVGIHFKINYAIHSTVVHRIWCLVKFSFTHTSV